MVVIYRVSKSVKKVHFEGKCTKKKINSTSFEIFSTALRKEKFETNVDFSSRGNSYFLKIFRSVCVTWYQLYHNFEHVD